MSRLRSKIRSDSQGSGLSKSFNYKLFLKRRDRLATVIFVLCCTLWLALFVIGIGSDWFEPLEQVKHRVLWAGLTVDNVLAIGAILTTVIAVAGDWLIRNLRRPPQLFLLLRDFQSKNAAQLASSYVHRYGSSWGYWITLENRDLKAADTIGGVTETDIDEESDKHDKPPLGSWWGSSMIFGLVFTTMLIMRQIDSPALDSMRRVARELGTLGDLVFQIIAVIGICLIWFLITLIIRLILLAIQRAVFLPGRISSEKTFHRVINSIFSRIRRRASTLTLGPMPVISVDDAWWKQAVLRCLAEARIVIFLITDRESSALSWEIDQVTELFDTQRTLFVKLGESELSITYGDGKPVPDSSTGSNEDRLEAAIRSTLI